MGKDDLETSKGRRRQLNVIYFIDSARTRTLTIPLGRLNLLLTSGALLAAWSVASAVTIVWLVRNHNRQSGRLREALSTIFEYETRDDKVFDLAYPPATKGSPNEWSTPVAEATPPSGLSLAAKALRPAAAAAPPDVAARVAAADGEGDGEDMPMADEESGHVAPKVAASDASAHKDEEPVVIVGNPVLEARGKTLGLRFDLTNKSGADRVEGMIWAVAEFKTEAGEHLFIGAPPEIKVKADGEPASPMHSTMFAIRRFKQKAFSFQTPTDKAGTFTAVRIGVMNRSGASKSTYNVPVQIGSGQDGHKADEPAAKLPPSQG